MGGLQEGSALLSVQMNYFRARHGNRNICQRVHHYPHINIMLSSLLQAKSMEGGVWLSTPVIPGLHRRLQKRGKEIITM